MPEIIYYNNMLRAHGKLVGETQRQCKLCGKRFVSLPGYVYKKRRGNHYDWYCSYSCYRKETEK